MDEGPREGRPPNPNRFACLDPPRMGHWTKQTRADIQALARGALCQSGDMNETSSPPSQSSAPGFLSTAEPCEAQDILWHGRVPKEKQIGRAALLNVRTRNGRLHTGKVFPADALPEAFRHPAPSRPCSVKGSVPSGASATANPPARRHHQPSHAKQQALRAHGHVKVCNGLVRWHDT